MQKIYSHFHLRPQRRNSESHVENAVNEMVSPYIFVLFFGRQPSKYSLNFLVTNDKLSVSRCSGKTEPFPGKIYCPNVVQGNSSTQVPE